MKRCPQCEFIYEDDQSLCDMDGVLLVFDSRTLPNLHALATVSAPLPGKTSRRNRMVPAFATLILMLALGSVYYVSTMRTGAPANFSPAAEAAPAVIPAEAPTLEAPTAEAPTPEPAAAVEEEKTEAPRETHASPAPKPVATSRKATTTTATKPEPKKDDSKVGSILKKTGKILKKPFKF